MMLRALNVQNINFVFFCFNAIHRAVVGWRPHSHVFALADQTFRLGHLPDDR